MCRNKEGEAMKRYGEAITGGLLTNAELKRLVLEKAPLVTTKQLAEIWEITSIAANAKISEWQTTGRMMVLKHERLKYVPLYCLDPLNNYEPLPVISTIISQLEGKMGPWQMVFWLESSNGYFEGIAPKEHLLDQPLRVIRSAEIQAFGPCHG